MNQLKTNLPLALLALLVLKQLFKGIDAAEMGVTVALAGIVALKDHLEKQSSIQEIKESTRKELAEVRDVVKTQNEVIEKMAKVLDENRNAVASMKLSSGMMSRKGA